MIVHMFMEKIDMGKLALNFTKYIKAISVRTICLSSYMCLSLWEARKPFGQEVEGRQENVYDNLQSRK